MNGSGGRWKVGRGRRLILASLVAAGGLAVPTTASGQAEPCPPDSTAPGVNPLDAVVTAALRGNLGLTQERMLEARAEAELDEARGRFLPSVTLDSRYTRQSGTLDLGDFVNPSNAALNQLLGEDRFPTDLELTLPLRHETKARLVQPVFDARIWAGWDASRDALRGQRAQRLAVARALAAEAQTAFLNVAAARSLRRVWEATVPLVTESERVAQRLVDVGTATPDAVFRARAERSDVEQKLQEAREQEDAAARAFNRVLGLPLDTPVDTIAEASLRFPLDLTEDEAVARALAGREELRRLGAGIAASEAGVRAATAGFLPNVAVVLDYGFQGRDVAFDRDHDFWTASLVVSWNVFNGGQDAARRAAAQADVRRLRARREEAEDLVRLDARQAWESAVVARDAIATAEDRRAAAERTFVLVRRRYEEGLATPIEFLDARTSLTNAELNRVVTVYRYAIRWVDLERAAALRDIATLEESR